MNKGNKTWHSSAWSKKLGVIADNRTPATLIKTVVVTRARYIITQRTMAKGVGKIYTQGNNKTTVLGTPSSSSKSIAMFSFEELAASCISS